MLDKRLAPVLKKLPYGAQDVRDNPSPTVQKRFNAISVNISGKKEIKDAKQGKE